MHMHRRTVQMSCKLEAHAADRTTGMTTPQPAAGPGKHKRQPWLLRLSLLGRWPLGTALSGTALGGSESVSRVKAMPHSPCIAQRVDIRYVARRSIRRWLHTRRRGCKYRVRCDCRQLVTPLVLILCCQGSHSEVDGGKWLK